MLVHRGHLYAVTDAGAATCWECATGKEVWKERLDGTFTASPVLVGETIYATSEAGRTFLFKARPEGFEQVGDNSLGGEVLASPAICGGRIYVRLARKVDGRRQEMLYCVGTR
jgi:outer membrane protein assembly factor BamB